MTKVFLYFVKIRPANLYRNVEGRWSDGRLTATHKKRNRKGSIVFCRDSSQRSTPGTSYKLFR